MDKLSGKVAGQKRSAHLAKKRKMLLEKLASGSIARSDVSAALARHGELSFGTRSRVTCIVGVRPYGLKDTIIAQAATHFGISARMVKSAWDELRALVRDAD